MYKMSEGLALHKVQNREESAFKSTEQMARAKRQQGLLEYLSSTGQVGRMPTRVALESAGKKDLADALVASYGGLHHAADAMGLSKRLLNEEAEAKKVSKREQAQQAAESRRVAAEEESERQQQLWLEQQQQQRHALGDEESAVEDDAPPGVGLLAPVQPSLPPEEEAAPLPAPASAAVPPPPRSTDSRWQYDRTGVYT